jgi:hypothetical protein
MHGHVNIKFGCRIVRSFTVSLDLRIGFLFSNPNYRNEKYESERLFFCGTNPEVGDSRCLRKPSSSVPENVTSQSSKHEYSYRCENLKPHTWVEECTKRLYHISCIGISGWVGPRDGLHFFGEDRHVSTWQSQDTFLVSETSRRSLGLTPLSIQCMPRFFPVAKGVVA